MPKCVVAFTSTLWLVHARARYRLSPPCMLMLADSGSAVSSLCSEVGC